MPKSNKTVLTRSAYTMAIVGGKHAEMTLYGDIVDARPVDWWTGEEVNGDFIIQGEFLADLETIKDCEDLTIHLNSCGGDAFVSLAIHNRLRELSAGGMDITCVVDACAMSGGSLIMCACDHVKVNPSSLILIHDCWSFAWDRFNSTKLRKLADDLDVINESQAEIYAAKTKMDHDAIRGLMQKETLMTGRKAVEMGLADELIENAEDPDIEVSADHKTLFVKGRKMKFAAMGELPEGLKVHEEVEPVSETDGGDKTTPEASGNNKGGIPMTLEELRQSDPEAAEALIAEAQACVSHEEAIRAERQRIADIDEVASLFDAETVNAAKYGENPCTAQEMVYRAAQEAAKTGKSFLNQLKADYEDDGACDVTSAPASEEDAKPETAEDRRALGLAMAKKLSGEKSEEV